GSYVATQVIKHMNKAGILVKDAHILILGFSFKENCPDIRNTKVIDIYSTLREYTPHITVYDPLANPLTVEQTYGLKIIDEEPQGLFDVIIISTAHKEFKDMEFDRISTRNAIIYDVKGILSKGRHHIGL
ncbi:UDP binding domain-containing protein, partial [Porphyromonas loveana]|uniref:UDP binding domain-containing protein n=1 Tax=Porphyromonas loveana TaxID=1884669 RepID=UPI00359F38F0